MAIAHAHAARFAALAAAFLTLVSSTPVSLVQPATLRAVVTAGRPAPGGGSFEHFSIESLPIVAPVNGKGQVAFFATLLRGMAGEGIFLASGTRISKVA